MKSIRNNVFETNSSSSHSVTLEYIDNERNTGWARLSLPYNEDKRNPLKFDILSIPLRNDGYAKDEISKARIVVALTAELIYDEYQDKVKKEWCEKNGVSKYSRNSGYMDYYNKKSRSKSCLNFFLGHRYWKYLNTVVKKHRGIVFEMYQCGLYPPFVSNFVDYETDNENRPNYLYVGFRMNMQCESYEKLVEEIIFDNSRAIYQETSERNP